MPPYFQPPPPLLVPISSTTKAKLEQFWVCSSLLLLWHLVHCPCVMVVAHMHAHAHTCSFWVPPLPSFPAHVWVFSLNSGYRRDLLLLCPFFSSGACLPPPKLWSQSLLCLLRHPQPFPASPEPWHWKPLLWLNLQMFSLCTVCHLRLMFL